MSNVLYILVRLLLALFFAFSAVSKIVDIDLFDIYVFRTFDIGLSLAQWGTRILAGVEFFIAIALLLGIKQRLVGWFSFGLVFLFSGFLVYQLLLDNSENCFCLGELLPMTPLQSLLKNVLLLLGLGFLLKSKPRFLFPFLNKAIVFVPVFLLAMALPFILEPLSFGNELKSNYSFEALTKHSAYNVFKADDKKMVAILSPKCRFCKMLTELISEGVDRNEIDQSDVYILFWGREESVQELYSTVKTKPFDYELIDTEDFMNITSGRLPTVFLVEKGEFVEALNYKIYDPKLVADFFDKP